MSPVVGAVNERPKDRSQAPRTPNTDVSAVKLSSSTNRRVMNQAQEVWSGSVVSAFCTRRPGAALASLDLCR